MEKALEHNLIYATLEKFGFREGFIQWIRTLICNISNCVMNKGLLTGYFNLNRGTKQGDPLSAYLLILCLEALLVRTRNASVCGFKFDKTDIRLTSFANDVTFLGKDVSSIKRILRIMKKFSTFSSLKINVEKCEACWLGKSKSNADKPINCK